jgi:energy-coupling factor transporter transmembrane protein EcfT
MILILFGFFISFITVILFLILCVKIIICFTKKKPFPKRLLIATLSGVVLFSSIYIYETYFYTFSEIDREFIQKGPGPVTSATKKYTANAYFEPYGGAAGGVNVWVEITDNNENNKVQTVYYSDAKSNFSMEWVDEDTLYILNDEPDYPNSNRSIALKIGKEIYHENGLACKSFLMKDEYETCYQN